MSEVGVIPYHGDGPEKQRGEAVAWLREQITARLELARATGPDEASRTWTGSDNGYEGAGEVSDGHGERVVYDEGAPNTQQALHIAANDPQQVTEDCEAELAILDRCATPVMTGVARDVVRYVASAYRHREGYAQHWGNGADVH